MRRKLKGIRIPIFALFILVPFCLAYSQYDGLAKIHFLSPITFENYDYLDEDEEDFVTDRPAQLEEIVLASFVNLSRLRIHSFQDFFPFPFQGFSFEQKNSILRC